MKELASPAELWMNSGVGVRRAEFWIGLSWVRLLVLVSHGQNQGVVGSGLSTPPLIVAMSGPKATGRISGSVCAPFPPLRKVEQCRFLEKCPIVPNGQSPLLSDQSIHVHKINIFL